MIDQQHRRALERAVVVINPRAQFAAQPGVEKHPLQLRTELPLPALFHSWLRSKLGARIYHNNRSLKGAPVLLINHSDLPFEPQLWLTALLVSSSHCPVEVFDAPVPGGELGLAVEHLQPRAVVLYSSKTLNTQQLPRLLQGIDCPTLIAGPTVCIHFDQLSVTTTEIAGLYLAHDPVEAHQRLSQLGLYR